MEFLAEYGMFFAKILTAVMIPLLAIGIAVLLFLSRGQGADPVRLEVKDLNLRFETMELTLNAAILPKKAFKQQLKAAKQRAKVRDQADSNTSPRKRVFVLGFEGDIRASAVTSLREEITAVLQVASSGDEVVILLESPGGMVHSYGLCASQLKRIRDKGITLTAAVDKIAASGGYLMACVADRIIAAPFAVLGSIGVVAQLPNFHRLLKQHNIDFEQITAGKYKRTLTLFGENSDADRDKFREELEETHSLFKEFVAENRPQLDIEKISTGEHWYGKRALELQLVDKIQTSDDYLTETASNADIFHVSHPRRRGLMDKLRGEGAAWFDRLFT